MKSLIKFSLVVAVVCLSSSAVRGSSLAVSGIFGGNLYEIYTYEQADDRSWENANTTAASLGGYLATIASQAEDDFVLGLLPQSASFGQLEYWLGGFFQAAGSTSGAGWTWVNGEGGFPDHNLGPVYANWAPGEPNSFIGLAENHLGYFLLFNGWNDEGDLANLSGFVVEKQGVIPEPSSHALMFVALCFAWRRRR